MSCTPTLEQILDRPDVWRGDALAKAPLPGVPTGFCELDRELPGGGWPRASLTELLPAAYGIGELSLLLPALARLSRAELAWLVCVAPPHPFYAPALHDGGVDLSRVLVAGAPGRDAVWVCERSLAADGVGAVVAWLPQAETAAGRATTEASWRALRRLQLAAEASRTLLFVFRPAACAGQSSPAPLRLLLEGNGERLIVRLLKRRGSTQPLPLAIAIDRPLRPRADHDLASPSSAALATRSFSRTAVA